jgi:hypothetical protein
MTMRRIGAGAYTVSGFRSALRDWPADLGVEFEVAEACLAHAVGNSITRAYLRSSMVACRRKVMADWTAFIAGEAPRRWSRSDDELAEALCPCGDYWSGRRVARDEVLLVDPPCNSIRPD